MDANLERLLNNYVRLCLDITERERARDAVKQQISNFFINSNGVPKIATGPEPQSLIEVVAANPNATATELAEATKRGYGDCIKALNQLLRDGQITVNKSRLPYRWQVADRKEGGK